MSVQLLRGCRNRLYAFQQSWLHNPPSPKNANHHVVISILKEYQIQPFAGYLHAGYDCANEVPRGLDVGVEPNARFCPNVIGAGRFADVAAGAGSIAVSVVLPGTGLIGTKMARRTGSIDEFEFKAIGENQTKA
ncbi:hypothetical protein Tco_0148923 [Tanacetum coccineum]